MSDFKYYTVAEVADMFHVSTQFVRDQVNSKRWPHKRLGPRSIVFSEVQVNQIDSLADVPLVRSGSHRERSRRVNTLLREVS